MSEWKKRLTIFEKRKAVDANINCPTPNKDPRDRKGWQTRGTGFPRPTPNSVVVLPPNFGTQEKKDLKANKQCLLS